ncbi:uncharacterized protein SCHCODRAFT_083965 [Schizophyllum commune H4-8]|uniref:Expressed protein n=1 Tax=Schizophyllum commune (strain H4-8 / FGSC 9210) TaxID=578458 RepID=D8PL29_SCHCM|nr:uncharacterized protein SCHCODRAFT_083965 [Schizophyllum commune H4-8]KAI5894291.1 hypothetical protein SCHCODRAFT_083965 [Schizophyllum commune H4-8]
MAADALNGTSTPSAAAGAAAIPRKSADDQISVAPSMHPRTRSSTEMAREHGSHRTKTALRRAGRSTRRSVSKTAQQSCTGAACASLTSMARRTAIATFCIWVTVCFGPARWLKRSLSLLAMAKEGVVVVAAQGLIFLLPTRRRQYSKFYAFSPLCVLSAFSGRS